MLIGRHHLVRLGISARILLLTFAVGLTFILYIGLTTEQQKQRDRKQVRDQVRMVAAVSGARLDDYLGDVTQFLTIVGQTATPNEAARIANDRMLQALVDQQPRNIASVTLWDVHGRGIGSTPVAPSPPAMSDSLRVLLARASSSRGLVAEGPVRIGKEWRATLALPIVRNGQIAAVIAAQVGLRSMPRLVEEETDLPDGASVAILNNEGRILARSPEPDTYIGQTAKIDRVALLKRFAEERGSVENTGVDGVQRIFGYARLRSVPWLVYIGVPVDQAMAATTDHARETLLIGLATLLVGLAVATFVASRLTLPLRTLVSDARQIEMGDLSHRSAVRTGSEIGRLAKSFNAMTQALQDRTLLSTRMNQRLELALEGSTQALYDWDMKANVVHRSARAAQIRGYAPVDYNGPAEPLSDDVHPDDLPGVVEKVRQMLADEVAVYDVEFRVRHASGDWVWVRSRARVVERDAEGRPIRVIGTDADIHARKLNEIGLRTRAEVDALTGLPNRAAFEERIAAALETTRGSGQHVAVLFVDIDHFKQVNDTFGHEVGDGLLKIVGQRLTGLVRSSDTVCRLGGDEFVVILGAISAEADAMRVAAKVVDALHAPAVIGRAIVKSSASVGVATCRGGDDTPAALLARADKALYASKRAGRDRFAVEDEDAA